MAKKKRTFTVLRVSAGAHERVRAVEAAAMELGAAEKTGDITEAYSVLCVARQRLYCYLMAIERPHRIEDNVTVRFL